MNEAKHYFSICNSAPSEVLALIAVRAKEIIIERNLNLIRTNIDCINGLINRYPEELSWIPPKAGCCALIRINPTSFPENINMDILADKLVNEYGVLILPGSQFPCADQEDDDGEEIVTTAYRNELNTHFRIGFARKDFPTSLQAFEDALFNDSEDQDEGTETKGKKNENCLIS